MPAVSVFVLSPDTRSERKFDLSLTVGQLKRKLEPITGIPAETQILSLHANEDDPKTILKLEEEERPLGYYSVTDWQAIRVEDSAGSKSLAGQFVDVSQVEKYEMSDKEYETRRDTVLAYKKIHQMGRFAPASEAEETKAPEIPEILVGSRCQVQFGDDGLKKRGAVRFVGETKFGGGGVWVGIEYDEPLGKNDGSVQGERYFTCKPKYGAFVRPDKVQVGDYPPIDPFEEAEDGEI